MPPLLQVRGSVAARPEGASSRKGLAIAGFLKSGALRLTAISAVFLLPIIVVPGLERPFFVPKLLLLSGGTILTALLAVLSGLPNWPVLPGRFGPAIALWLAALSVSASLGALSSPAALTLPVLAAVWFVVVMVARPPALHLAWTLMMSSGDFDFQSSHL